MILVIFINANGPYTVPLAAAGSIWCSVPFDGVILQNLLHWKWRNNSTQSICPLKSCSYCVVNLHPFTFLFSLVQSLPSGITTGVTARTIQKEYEINTPCFFLLHCLFQKIQSCFLFPFFFSGPKMLKIRIASVLSKTLKNLRITLLVCIKVPPGFHSSQHTWVAPKIDIFFGACFVKGLCACATTTLSKLRQGIIPQMQAAEKASKVVGKQ